MFKGLPYAGPQGGNNRFAAPTPVEPWEGVRIADTWPASSMHWSGINPVGEFYGDEFYYVEAWLPPISENGASLNVFTPAQGPDEALPVYVWFHGGANAHGYASEIEFWAAKLAEKGIVVVSAQYRLGPFGEIALQEIQDESPKSIEGNQAATFEAIWGPEADQAPEKILSLQVGHEDLQKSCAQFLPDAYRL